MAGSKRHRNGEPLESPDNDQKPQLRVALAETETAAIVGGPQFSSNVISALVSPEASLSEAPSEIDSVHDSAASGVDKRRRGQALSRTLQALQQSQLWMGATELPKIEVDLSEPPVRITRRMAAQQQKEHRTEPLAASSTQAGTTQRDLPQRPGYRPRRSSHQEAASVSHRSDLVKKSEEISEATSQPKAEAEQTELQDSNAGLEKSSSSDKVLLKPQRSAQQPRCRPADLHLNHVIFDKLRYIPLVAPKAPMASELEVVTSSSYLMPSSLVEFTKLMIQEAPDMIMSLAGKRPEVKSEVPY